MRQVTDTMNQTSPYYPQSDGELERWHAISKSMMRKVTAGKRDWDELLPYSLFASVPHSNMGFTTFELPFGRHVRGPLEVLKAGR